MVTVARVTPSGIVHAQRYRPAGPSGDPRRSGTYFSVAFAAQSL
jgi:hypothetical protein